MLDRQFEFVGIRNDLTVSITDQCSAECVALRSPSFSRLVIVAEQRFFYSNDMSIDRWMPKRVATVSFIFETSRAKEDLHAGYKLCDYIICIALLYIIESVIMRIIIRFYNL